MLVVIVYEDRKDYRTKKKHNEIGTILVSSQFFML
jgi:hypothetical protein